jgi:hypothetical protein
MNSRRVTMTKLNNAHAEVMEARLLLMNDSTIGVKGQCHRRLAELSG